MWITCTQVSGGVSTCPYPIRPPAPPPPGRLVKFHAPEIVFGIGSMVEAAHAVLRLGGSRPMLVTDPGLIDAGWATELQDQLREQGLTPVVWSALTPNPKDHEIAAGHDAYREGECDVLVALGGGSVIDATKGIAVLAANGGATSSTTRESTRPPVRSRRW